MDIWLEEYARIMLDLSQKKLNKSEWESIEKGYSLSEKRIIELLYRGKDDLERELRVLPSFTDCLHVTGFQNEIFERYLAKTWTSVSKLVNELCRVRLEIPVLESRKPRKADIIRFNNLRLDQSEDTILEPVLLALLKACLRHKKKESRDWMLYYYTLLNVRKNSCSTLNEVLEHLVDQSIELVSQQCDPYDIVLDGVNVIERNALLHKYTPIRLFGHQRSLIKAVCRSDHKPQLISYTAPTGTGKTLTPLGLLSTKCVIFMCAARHIGLSLARAAIAAEAAVAFAFGCSEETDVRLHYSAATRYTKDTRSGGIRKVDNTEGEKVRLLVCDMQSYPIAMRYMLKYQNPADLVWYWDEPTMTLDQDSHACHELIFKNWQQNEIPTVVLCSATLPCSNDLQDVHAAFKNKFEGAETREISSHDFKKSIALLNKDGYAETPHSCFETAGEVKSAARVCMQSPTILRYVDLGEVIRFMSHPAIAEQADPRQHFRTVEEVSMETIKKYYLRTVLAVENGLLEEVCADLKSSQEPEYASTIYASSKDAHTITNGPAVFLCNDTNKVGKFLLQQARIPEAETDRVMKIIAKNDAISRKILVLEQNLADCTAKDVEAGRGNKLGREERGGKATQELRGLISTLSSTIQSAALSSKYVPNKPLHLRRFNQCPASSSAFTNQLTEDDLTSIMSLADVSTSQKLLLMLGIGVFEQNLQPEYLSVIKEFADQQKLYLIVASADYTYGTNYQFCHGFVGAGLGSELSREKSIQAFGRVGRGKCQQTYSVRVRDDSVIRQLFSPSIRSPERDNMIRLLS